MDPRLGSGSAVLEYRRQRMRNSKHVHPRVPGNFLTAGVAIPGAGVKGRLGAEAGKPTGIPPIVECVSFPTV